MTRFHGTDGIGIEIEHQSVGLFDVVGATSPDVQLQCAELHDAKPGREGRARPDTCRFRSFSRISMLLDVGRQAFGRMALEETWAAHAGGATDQRERAVGDVRQNPVGDLDVVIGQIALGDALIRDRERDRDV